MNADKVRETRSQSVEATIAKISMNEVSYIHDSSGGSEAYYSGTGVRQMLYGYHELLESKSQEVERLREALKPFQALAKECLYNSNLNKDQAVYAYNKAEISMKDLLIVDSLLNTGKVA